MRNKITWLRVLWTFAGSVSLRAELPDEILLRETEKQLERQQKSPIRSARGVEFYDPLWENFFGHNWLTLAVFERGSIWIERSLEGRDLRYEIHSLHTFIFCLVAAVLAGLFGLFDRDLTTAISFAAAAFAWLYGMNLLLAAVRVPAFFRRVAKVSDVSGAKE